MLVTPSIFRADSEMSWSYIKADVMLHLMVEWTLSKIADTMHNAVEHNTPLAVLIFRDFESENVEPK